MITIRQHGNFKKITGFLEKAKERLNLGILDKYGRKGVELLKKATPVDDGLTANSWYYKIDNRKNTAIIYFGNTNIQNGFPVAIMLQYGHGTGTGGWVEGRDYINPVIQPLFDQIVYEAWKEVTET